MSKDTAQGVVGYVGSKEVKGRTYWSFKLDNDENWYRTGTFQPKCKKGEYVSFEFETNQYGNQVDSRTIVIKEEVGAAKQTPSKAAKATSGGLTKDGYWENKEAKDESRQNVISYQAAHNTAATICAAAVANDALPLPSKKSDKFDAFVEAVRVLALELYTDFSSVYEGKDPRSTAAAENSAVDFSDMDDFDNEDNFDE